MRLALIVAVAGLILVAGCTSSEAPEAPNQIGPIQNDTPDTGEQEPEERSTFQAVGNITLDSSTFSDGGPLPRSYTCDGIDNHPQLTVGNIPDGAASLAFIVDDPDAGMFTHWIAWNLPTVEAFADGSNPGTAGTNDAGNIGYNGPCPPEGEEHTYRFRVYALDTELTLSEGAERDALETAMDGHILAATQITATYER